MIRRDLKHRWAVLAAAWLGLLAAAIVLSTAGRAEAPRTWRLAFEVISSEHAQPARKAMYEEKERLTRAALAEIVPHVWTQLGAVAARARSRVRAGGYKDAINPAIQSNVVIAENDARRLAAALGYVFRQWAVLMYDLDAEPATHRYVSVRFPRGTLGVEMADRYFARARAQLASDKLGFSSTGTRLLFINLATGIADDAFSAGLGRAAADLPDAGIKVEPAKPVRAFLIENDWTKSKDGEDYAMLLGDAPGALAALGRLRGRHDGRVRRWAQSLR